MLSLTIPVISANFSNLYAHVVTRDQASVRIRRKASAAVEPVDMKPTGTEADVPADVPAATADTSKLVTDNVTENDKETQAQTTYGRQKERCFRNFDSQRSSIPE